MWNDSEKNVLILGHRGICSHYPDNTMVSFSATVDAGVDMIETDVQLSKDGVAILCHDLTVDRTTDGTGLIKDKTLLELKMLDAGIKKNLKFKGERIPKFEELLVLVKNTDILLNVEIKSYTHDTVDETIKLLKKYNLHERSVIACFNAEIIRYTKQMYPYMKTQGFPARMMEDFTDDTYNCMYGMGIPGEWITWAKTTKELVIEDVNTAKAHGIHPWLFVSDDENTVRKCVEYGTCDVTGNNPFPALEYLPKVGLHKPIYNNIKPIGNMLSANLHGIGDLRIENVNIPDCGDDEVVVQIQACGICGSDIDRVFRKGTYHFPTIPGHEFAGKVVYDKNTEFLGKRVAVFPLLPCMKCDSCKKEQYAQCKQYDYYGSRRDGGFAEYITVKKFNLVEIPINVTYEEAAMCEPVSVALCATLKLNIKGGEHILITGAGPIGLIAGMWAKSLGAKKVSYIDIDKEKLEFCVKHGFDVYESGEVDCVLEGTGALLETAIKIVKTAGNIVLMGNPSFDLNLKASDYQLILRKELHINGTWNSNFSHRNNNWIYSLQAMSEGRIIVNDLITHRIQLKDCVDALNMMLAKNEFYCKVMITNEM